MDLLHRMLYTFVGAFSIFYFFVKVSLSHWKKRGILHEKANFFWGNLKGVGTKRHITEALNDIYERNKGKAPFIGFYAWLRPLVLVLDVELARHILITDAVHFKSRGLYNNIDDEPLSENLIQLDGSSYEALHKKALPYYDRVVSLVPAMVHVADNFRRSLLEQQKKTEIMNINCLISAYNTDVISFIAFGIEGDSLNRPDTEFCGMARAYLNKSSLFKLYLAWSFPNLARIFYLKTYDDYAAAYFTGLVSKRLDERSRLQATEPANMNFLQFFVETEKKCKVDGKCSARIAAQCCCFLSAGLEASTSTLAFCLYELAQQTKIQEKAREEIDIVLTKHKDKITADSLDEMVYLKQIIYETLRKHSPYPFLLRNTTKDYEVPDSVFMLQKGNSIIIPVSSIHHDPRIYPSPEHFDPTRFSDEEVSKRNPAAFLPFGAGPRSCLTRKFAEFQMLICLIILLKEYKFSTCSKTNLRMQYDQKRLIVTPKDEIMLRLERI